MTPAQANLIRATALSILAPGSGIYRDGVREALAVVDAETARALNAPRRFCDTVAARAAGDREFREEIERDDEDPSHIQLTPLADDNWGWVVWYGSGDENKRDADGIAPSLADALAQVAEVVHAPRSPAPPDSIVAEVRADLLARSEAGIARYGVTLDRKDLGLGAWMRHIYEELLDGALYAKRAMRELAKEGDPWPERYAAAVAVMQAERDRLQVMMADVATKPIQSAPWSAKDTEAVMVAQQAERNRAAVTPAAAPVEPPHAAVPALRPLTPEPAEAVLGRAREALAGSLPVYVLAGTGRHPYGDDAWHMETDGVARLFPSKEAAQRWLSAMGKAA